MKIRVISALVALGILIPFLIIGGYPFAFIICFLGIICYKEILDLKKSHDKIPMIVVILGLISLVYIMIGNYGFNSLTYAITYPKVLIPMILLLLPTLFYKKITYNTNDALYLLGNIYLIGFLFNLIITIRNINIYLLLYLLSITIFTDTFAYLIGMLIGKHKMTKISPKKSWEGAIAGLIGGSSVALIIYTNLLAPLNFKIILTTIILSIIGQMGDLFFSKIKRENDIKDFSNIMPGHGGILDRVDSLTFVIFAYVILLSLL